MSGITDRDLVVGDPDTFYDRVRENDTAGDPCSVCANELLWDRYEHCVYCVNDWYHG